MLATSFSLLKLPKIPELREKTGKINFKPIGSKVDIFGIQYKDRSREEARQKRLTSEVGKGKKNHKQTKVERRIVAREQQRKEDRQQAIKNGHNPNKRRGKQAQMFHEWDALAKEERLHKKLKQGKITEEKFQLLMYGDKDDVETMM